MTARPRTLARTTLVQPVPGLELRATDIALLLRETAKNTPVLDNPGTLGRTTPLVVNLRLENLAAHVALDRHQRQILAFPNTLALRRVGTHLATTTLILPPRIVPLAAYIAIPRRNRRFAPALAETLPLAVLPVDRPRLEFITACHATMNLAVTTTRLLQHFNHRQDSDRKSVV